MCLHYCISCRSLESLLQKIWFTYSFFVDYFYANIYFIIIVLTYYITTIYEYEYWALELKWVEWVPTSKMIFSQWRGFNKRTETETYYYHQKTKINENLPIQSKKRHSISSIGSGNQIVSTI